MVRVVAGPPSSADSSLIIDYREKLPGRAAYICPTYACIQKAITKAQITKALKSKARIPSTGEFIALLRESIERKIQSLVAMAQKADKLAAGYSGVRDALEKNRVKLLLYAHDFSEGSRGKIENADKEHIRQATFFTRETLGRLLNRELVGVIALEDSGLADAIWKEAERLKDLINTNE